ncbi:hypothetical protein PGTUg99_017191 [Puccinia graminis f. sp. tritici]|uniref:FAS1 domain-containing protein n=1 Tax=Puccinia graminis f. sp. tritici TaxID=56615 RepID=A0A5B0PL21_PUCGR|nr:hypothetical protein PGTUg99_017191 [Puccinia graminis f. sp. tritici]
MVNRILLLLLPLLPLLISAEHHQQQQTSFELPRTSTSTTLIDLLSNSTEHTKLLHLIQISRLVPTINSLSSASLFAPTNQAIESAGLSSLSTTQDNLQLELRQTLLYHLLNYTLPDSTGPSDSPQLLDSLLFPEPINTGNTDDRRLLLGHQPQKLRIIQRDQDRFIGVDQRGQGGIRLPPPDQFQNATNGILIPIQSILKPPRSLKHLIKSTPTLSTYASILPDRLLDQLDLLPHLTIFAPQNQAWDHLNSIELGYLRSNFSADDSIKLFRQATADNVLGSEGIGYSDLLRREALKHQPAQSFVLFSVDGKPLSIGIDPKSNLPSINGSEIIENDILASNGVLHIVPNLLISSGDNPLQLTPEKYLLALNCTKFVSLFRQANLSSTYLDNRSSDKSYTILAVRDDVLRSTSSSSSLGRSSIDRLKTNDTESLKKSLRYHVIEGNYLIDDLEDGMLLRTELKLQGGSSSNKQRMPVSVSTNDRKGLSKSPIIGFGGANVVGGDPIQVGNTVIYILSQIVEPPSDLLQVALSDIRFSTGVASIFSAKLDHQLQALPELTYLMPTNKAFANLGLIMDYLLLEKSKPDLLQVLKYHAVTEVIYLNELKIGSSQRYPTLEGTELYISKLATNNVTLHGPTVGGVALNGEDKDSEVINKRDVLVENGSMQFISQVELPPGVNIDLRKLMVGAKATTMLELIQATNLTWILDSGVPPSSSKDDRSSSGQKKNKNKEDQINLSRGYTILCPSDSAFTKINLTYFLEDPIRLESLVRQHIIPVYPDESFPGTGDSLDHTHQPPALFEPLYLEDGLVYPTLLSTKEGGPSRFGDLSFRFNRPQEVNNHGDHRGSDDDDDNDRNKFFGKWRVGIKGARGTDQSHDSARILNYGRATPKIISSSSWNSSFIDSSLRISHPDSISFAGGVLAIDIVLLPYYPSFWNRIGKFIFLFFFLTLIAVATGFGGWKIYQIKYRRNNYAAVRVGPGGGIGGYQVVEPMEE